MTDTYPLFQKDLEGEITKAIISQDIKEKIKLIAINYNIQKKKKLDIELEKIIQKKLKQKEERFREIQEKENQIINGNLKLSELKKLVDEIGQNDKFHFDEKQIQMDYEKQKNEKIPGIYPYWGEVMKKCPSIYTLLQEKNNTQSTDTKLAQSIKNIEFQRNNLDQEHQHDFTIIFDFDMDNKTASEHLKGNGQVRKQFQMYNSVMPFSSEVQIETNKVFQNESFFTFFDPCNLEDALDKNEEERRKLEMKMGKQFEIAQLFILELIPYSLEYYLGLRDDQEADQDPLVKEVEEQQIDLDKIQKKKDKKPITIDQFKDRECQIY